MDSPSPIRNRSQHTAPPPRRRKIAQEIPDESMSMLMDLTLTAPNPTCPPYPQSRPLHPLVNAATFPDESMAFNQLNEDDLKELAFREVEEREKKRKERKDFLKEREFEKSKLGKENQGKEQLSYLAVSNEQCRATEEEKVSEQDEKGGVEPLSTTSTRSKSPAKSRLRRRRAEVAATGDSLSDDWLSRLPHRVESDAVSSKPEKEKEEVDILDKMKGPSNQFQKPLPQTAGVPQETVLDASPGQKQVGEQAINQGKPRSRLPRKSSFVSSNKGAFGTDFKENKQEIDVEALNLDNHPKIKSRIPSSTTSPTKPSFKHRATSSSNKIPRDNTPTTFSETASAIGKKAAEPSGKIPDSELANKEGGVTSDPTSAIAERGPCQTSSISLTGLDVESSTRVLSKEKDHILTHAKLAPLQPAPDLTSFKSTPSTLPSTLTSQRAVSASKLPSSIEVPVGFRKTSTGALVADPTSSAKPFSFSASLPASSKPQSVDSDKKKSGAYRANQVPEWIKARKQKLEIEREFKLKKQLESIRRGVKESSKDQSKARSLSRSTNQKPLTSTKVQAFNLTGAQRSKERKEFERIRDENQRVLEKAREEARKELERQEEEEMKRERERTIIRASEIPASSRRVLKK